MNTKLIITLAFLVTFILGGATGYFVARNAGYESRDRIERERPGQERMEGQERQERQFRDLRARMVSELELTEEQERPFFTLISEHRQNIREVMDLQRREIDRKMSSRAESLHQALSQILTPEQLEIWEEKYSRQALRDRQMRQHRRGR